MLLNSSGSSTLQLMGHGARFAVCGITCRLCCVVYVDVELRVDNRRRPVKFNDRQLDVSVVKGLKLTDRRFTPSDTQNSIAGQLLMQSASPSVNR